MFSIYYIIENNLVYKNKIKKKANLKFVQTAYILTIDINSRKMAG